MATATDTSFTPVMLGTQTDPYMADPVSTVPVSDVAQTYGPFDYPVNSPSLPPYPPYTPDQTTTTVQGQAADPSTVSQINALAATLDSAGLSWFANITGKPLVAAPGQTPGSIVSPQQQNLLAQQQQTNTMIIIVVIGIAALLILRH